MTIILAEDEPQLRDLMRETLELEGYRVVACSNGEEALQALANPPTPIDLLLTDVVMPGMNGRELATKALAQSPSLDVLFMSGYMDDVVLQGGVSDAHLSFLQKPFSMQTLLDTVRHMLSKKAPSS